MKRTPMRVRPAVDHRAEAGYVEWKRPTFGECAACGERDRLIRHHVIRERDVRLAGGAPYDLRNSLPLGAGFRCSCHRDHHATCSRLPLEIVPAAALEFAVELLGAAAADAYFDRFYAAG